MTRKPKAKPDPKLTDEERRKRSDEMAREAEASEALKDFDEAFKKVVRPPPTRGSGR